MKAIEFYIYDFLESIPNVWAHGTSFVALKNKRDHQENHKEILNNPGMTAK